VWHHDAVSVGKGSSSLAVAVAVAVALAVASAACNSSPIVGVPASSGPPKDAAAPDSTISTTMDATIDQGAAPDTAVSDNDANTGSCFTRPACEVCFKEAGVCCDYPNPNPPPGPEYAVSCTACPADGGLKFDTMRCNDETDCPKSQVCCISLEGDASTIVAACAPGCDPLKNQVQLCNANATTSACPPTSPCSRNNIDMWNLPHCYGTCGGIGL
jgi:hypothetical protein